MVMNRESTDNGFLMRSKRFIHLNGLYITASEMMHRTGVAFRRWMLAGKLGCPDIVIGPRSYLRGLGYISIGKNFKASEGLWLEAIANQFDGTHIPCIKIGDNVSISKWSHIAATNRVEIGNGVLIGSKVLITDHGHGQYTETHTSPLVPPVYRPVASDRQVIIGGNVWIGDGVVVCPGSNIGEGVVIGANAVVTGTIAPFTLAVGIPARPLKHYSFEINEWVNIQ
jgi:lipopolysaccharide O-acetyltransferase